MRRFLKIAGVALAVVLLAAVLLPWWLGGALWVLKKPLGLTSLNYERVGYSAFVLTDVRLEQKGFNVTVGRAETVTPLLWAWRHLRNEGSPIVAQDWVYQVKPTRKNTEKPKMGWLELRATLMDVFAGLQVWLPDARVERGVVRLPAGDLRIVTATWDGENLDVKGLEWAGRAADAKLAVRQNDDLLRLSAVLRDETASVELESRGPDLTGTATVLKQPVQVAAHFTERRWLPAEASAKSDDWSIGGAEVHLGEAYTQINGRLNIQWRKEAFTIEVAAKGTPVPDQNIPPLEFEASGHGDMDTLTIEAIRAQVPGLSARLSQPVRMNREGQLLSGPSRLEIDADLAQQNWVAAKGKVSGEAIVQPGPDYIPRVSFRLSAQQLQIKERALQAADVNGVFVWPEVDVKRANVDFGGDDKLSASGRWNLKTRELVAGEAEAHLKGSTLATWWPRAPKLQTLAVSVRGSGPLASLSHEGTVSCTELRVPPMHPAVVDLTWKGRGAAVENIEGTASTKGGRVAFAGGVNLEAASVERLSIQVADAAMLTLQKPVRIFWKPEFRFEPVILAGEGGRLEAEARLGVAGTVRVAVREFTTRWLREFLQWRGPDWRINTFEFAGSWSDNPMTFTTRAGVQTEFAHDRLIELQLTARGDRKGINVETFRLLEAGSEALAGSGRVPIMITPAMRPLYSIDENAALELKAATRHAAMLWAHMEEMSGLKVVEPSLEAAVSGTWKAPSGKITLRVPEIAAKPGRFKRSLPAIADAEAVIEFAKTEVTLRTLSLMADGQAVRADGKLALPQGGWGAIGDDFLKYALRESTLHVQVPEAEMSAIARHAPDLIAAKGWLSADVTVSPGMVFGGYVRIKDAGSRPLGPLGILQDVNVEIELAERVAHVRELEAKMGGQIVQMNGTAGLSENLVPVFNLTLRGNNLPFVRKIGLLLRGDLDLKMVSDELGIGTISGVVNLRDSLFSSDVRDMVPKGGPESSAERRPPYFSVEAEPLRTWRLDVNVQGQRFLKMRTPVFNGLASMRFKLGGTLGQPRATGEATIDEGDVLLPFASFAIQQGSIRLTEANPYEPALFITGTSRRYGYDLRMEVSGNASSPIVAFSSSPPLDSEEVLLLVMAGELPNDEISYSGTQRAAKLGTYLGRSLFSAIRGNDSGGDRLSISSGEKISRQGRETYTVEYELDPRWSFIGEYDEFDDYNAGVRWQIFKDRKREEATKKNAD